MKSTGIVFIVTGSIEAMERFQDWANNEEAFADIDTEERMTEDPNDAIGCSILIHNVPGDGFPHATITEIVRLHPDLFMRGAVASPTGTPWYWSRYPGQFPVITVVGMTDRLQDAMAGAV